jgi:predicted histone-like DNA-binding protein
MSIYYKMIGITDKLNPSESKKQGFYPRIVSRKTVGLRELCEDAARGSSLNAFELEVAARMLVKGIINELGDGNNVCIDGFGTFSVSAEAIREAQNEHDIRAESIRAKRIVFRTSKTFMGHLPFKFQRLPDK